MPACVLAGFLRAAPHVRMTDPWHARGGGSRAWRRGWELLVREACSVEEGVRWGLWGIRLGGWARVWKGGAEGGEEWVLEACDGLGVRIAGSEFGVIAGRI